MWVQLYFLADLLLRVKLVARVQAATIRETCEVDWGGRNFFKSLAKLRATLAKVQTGRGRVDYLCLNLHGLESRRQIL